MRQIFDHDERVMKMVDCETDEMVRLISYVFIIFLDFCIFIFPKVNNIHLMIYHLNISLTISSRRLCSYGIINHLNISLTISLCLLIAFKFIQPDPGEMKERWILTFHFIISSHFLSTITSHI